MRGGRGSVAALFGGEEQGEKTESQIDSYYKKGRLEGEQTWADEEVKGLEGRRGEGAKRKKGYHQGAVSMKRKLLIQEARRKKRCLRGPKGSWKKPLWKGTYWDQQRIGGRNRKGKKGVKWN